MRQLLMLSAATTALISAAAPAQQTGQGGSADTGAAAQNAPAEAAPSDAKAATADNQPGLANPRGDIVVTARRLDAARASIQPSLGATSYTISNATIQALPGADNQQFNQIVLQLPGVVQDGFGQFHVRDDHSNLQYRINGTILPEGIAVFGQTLSPRLIDKFSLLTGALPAQYGPRTAGILDITTKSGFKNGGSISLYGGSHDTIEPSIEYGGSTGSTNYFVSGSFSHDRLGIGASMGLRIRCTTRPTRATRSPMSTTFSTIITASRWSPAIPISISRSPIRAAFTPTRKARATMSAG